MEHIVTLNKENWVRIDRKGARIIQWSTGGNNILRSGEGGDGAPGAFSGVIFAKLADNEGDEVEAGLGLTSESIWELESQGGTDTEQIAVLVTTVTKDDDVAQGAVLKLALTLTLKEDALVMTLAVQNAGTSGYEFTLELQSAVAVTALSTCGLRGEYIERRVAGQESEVGRRRVGGAAAALHKPFDRIFEGCVGAHMVTDVGPSRDRTAADHSTVTTHLDLAITKANLPDMRATVDVGAEDSTLVCSSAVLSTRGLGGAVAGGQTWIGGQTMTAIPRF